ncbi:MAG: HRDC domain-containing protein [Propionibacteriaceae bacterium]|nr:HRDC domain-containing protein [Propionibacteriaceae bacterium]
MSGPDALPVLVTTPRQGRVDVIADKAALRQLIRRVDPNLPVALDAERAQSYRYSSKAYLIQLRQEGIGTCLLDPIALAGPDTLADLRALSNALSGCEWVLHAASQDLPCLVEVGMVPQRLFDTELAGRLLGLDRVSLSPMLTKYLGIELAKTHSADDWSRRPLPQSWLTYAALDVDYLLDLRQATATDLSVAGKMAWAQQEFDYVLSRFAIDPSDPADRWRFIKGIGRLRRPRDLAVAQKLWEVRDDLARQIDIAPRRILTDTDLVTAAGAFGHMKPAAVRDNIGSQPGFTGRLAKRQRRRWVSAVDSALEGDPSHWPNRPAAHGAPPPRLWDRSNPEAAKRWALARTVVIETAEAHALPVENLMTVATLGEVMWPDDGDFSEAGLADAFAQANARPWQIELVVPGVATALALDGK